MRLIVGNQHPNLALLLRDGYPPQLRSLHRGPGSGNSCDWQ
jgi:hypothetical protein